jgi:hypothetical protein
MGPFNSDGSVSNGHPSSLHIIFEDVPQANTTDGSNNQYRKSPSEYTAPVWHLGWTDGRYGQPISVNEEALRSHSTLEWLERVAVLELRIAALKASVNYFTDSCDRMKQKLFALGEQYRELWELRKEKHQEFSIPLALVYVFFAVVMILADLPLSLRLVALGFNVETEFPLNPKNPASLTRIDALFVHPEVIPRGWEALLLALGIACVGIFIKYFLDTMVLRDESKAPSRRFARTMLVVFGLFVASSLILGMFRARMQGDVTQRDITKQVEEVYLKRLDAGLLTRGANEVQDKEKIRKEVEGTHSKESGWATASFIALTLLLPIVGGICFSEGWRRLENAKHYNFTKAARWLAERQYERMHAQYQQDAQELAALEAKQEREDTNMLLRDSMTNLQLSLYRHGYSRGQNVPETIYANESLYSRCEKSIIKLFSRRLRAKSWAGMPSSGKP